MPPHTHNNVHQLRPDDDDLNVEVYAISALLDKDTWEAASAGITADMFLTYRKAFEWCDDYVSTSGTPPPVDVVMRRFPDLAYIPGYDLGFAAKELRNEHAERLARIYLHQAAQDVAKGDLASYRQRLLAAATEARPTVTSVDITDDKVWEEVNDGEGLMVDDGMLGAMTKGIRPGDFWVFAARLGTGKSYRMLKCGLKAVELGAHVTYFSMELTAPQVAVIASKMMNKGKVLPPAQMREQFEASGGRFSVVDPSMTTITPDLVASAKKDQPSLAIVDHVGLMHSSRGARNSDDWRIAQEISNTLKEVALSQKLPIIAASQINREGSRSKTAPEAHHLANTDALGQDADLVLTMRRASERVIVNRLAKNRWDKTDVMWYSKFLPAEGFLADVSASQAKDLIAQDMEKHEAQL
jgi:hypothetical protein